MNTNAMKKRTGRHVGRIMAALSQMAYHVDGIEAGENPHVNYEPSNKIDSLREAPRTGKDHTPFVSGTVVRQKIGRQNNYGQAGARYRSMEGWERDELVNNLVNLIGLCDRNIQERMFSHLSQSDEEYGRRVAEGLGVEVGAQPTADTVGAR
jgi:catalase